MSPLLLENSNKASRTLGQPSEDQNKLDQAIEASQITWSTPRKSTELKNQALKFQQLEDCDLYTQRLLFRKITKGFEEQESLLATQEL